MRDASSFAWIGMERRKFWFGCAILGRAFPAESSNNFSNHFFRQKRKAPEWDWRLPAVSSRRTAELSRAKIVTTAARVLPFASLKQKRPNPRRFCLRRTCRAERNNGRSAQNAVEFKHPLALILRIESGEAFAPGAAFILGWDQGPIAGSESNMHLLG